MLKFLSLLYLLIVKVRNFLYDHKIFKIYHFQIPIICVGNVTVGGNGKTPIVIKIANDLKKKGYRPVVLSRGYGGVTKGPYLLQKFDDPKKVGDEPILIASQTNLPLVIARDRVAGAKIIQQNNLGDIIVMDDGFQHQRLYRNLNILCFDLSSDLALERATNGLLLPAGRLREPLADALRRTQLIILNSRHVQFSTLDDQKLRKRFKTIPVYETKLAFGSFTRLDQSIPSSITSNQVILLTGIANPEGLQLSLKNLELQVIDQFLFPDHYYFTRDDLENIFKKYPKQPIICTPKDAVKLKLLEIDRSLIWVLNSEIVFKDDESPDWSLMLKAI